ncbi:MAG: SDR family NAD(P)-dependent oxidoreductase [Bacteroides sp.]|nr:SDR family NAD(P)-dependent oxidoreductase [Prevotella sp.]MCM1408449.1 SDR family NAD(P)-dependent oxidoreductase [Treponema brennaborense]MCM1469389.1 SDR family NAD(P)-dependent oxidoreductase [Bacteroides sp.]
MQAQSKRIFSGKKAVVIGGTGAVGAHLCEKLAQAGASLIVHGGHSSKTFSDLVEKLKKLTDAAPLVYDFSDAFPDFPEQLSCSAVLREAASADILCVCYGPFLQKPFALTQAAEWDRIIRLNCTLPGIVISSALPQMIEKKWGRILLFGGTATDIIRGFSTNAAYGAAKTAAGTLVKSVALAYARSGITANAVMPGQIQPENASQSELDELKTKMRCENLLCAETVAEAAFFLLSHAEINGAFLRTDSGWMPEQTASR